MSSSSCRDDRSRPLRASERHSGHESQPTHRKEAARSYPSSQGPASGSSYGAYSSSEGVPEHEIALLGLVAILDNVNNASDRGVPEHLLKSLRVQDDEVLFPAMDDVGRDLLALEEQGLIQMDPLAPTCSLKRPLRNSQQQADTVIKTLSDKGMLFVVFKEAVLRLLNMCGYPKGHVSEIASCLQRVLEVYSRSRETTLKVKDLAADREMGTLLSELRVYSETDYVAEYMWKDGSPMGKGTVEDHVEVTGEK